MLWYVILKQLFNILFPYVFCFSNAISPVFFNIASPVHTLLFVILTLSYINSGSLFAKSSISSHCSFILKDLDLYFSSFFSSTPVYLLSSILALLVFLSVVLFHQRLPLIFHFHIYLICKHLVSILDCNAVCYLFLIS